MRNPLQQNLERTSRDLGARLVDARKRRGHQSSDLDVVEPRQHHIVRDSQPETVQRHLEPRRLPVAAANERIGAVATEIRANGLEVICLGEEGATLHRAGQPGCRHRPENAVATAGRGVPLRQKSDSPRTAFNQMSGHAEARIVIVDSNHIVTSAPRRRGDVTVEQYDSDARFIEDGDDAAVGVRCVIDKLKGHEYDARDAFADKRLGETPRLRHTSLRTAGGDVTDKRRIAPVIRATEEFARHQREELGIPHARQDQSEFARQRLPGDERSTAAPTADQPLARQLI